MLIDEPEAFLHPPLARQVGELIGSAANECKQIFVSTHNVEVLKGILGTCNDINVVRITQPEKGYNEISILNPIDLQTIMETPLLRVSKTLEGLFCERVIITEAEADEIIYQEIIEKLVPQSGFQFIHTHGKSAMKTVVESYQKLKINYDVIVDFDALRDKDSIKIFLSLGKIEDKDKDEFQSALSNFREYIKFIGRKEFLPANYLEIQEKEKRKEEKKKAEKKKLDEVFHEIGISYFDNLKSSEFDSLNNQMEYPRTMQELAQIGITIKELIKRMEKNHIYILLSGELESMFVNFGVQYTHNKNYWIKEALDCLPSLDKESLINEKDLAFLIELLKRYKLLEYKD